MVVLFFVTTSVAKLTPTFMVLTLRDSDKVDTQLFVSYGRLIFLAS